MADVNVSVMADRTPITVAIVRLRTIGLPEGTDNFFREDFIEMSKMMSLLHRSMYESAATTFGMLATTTINCRNLGFGFK